MSQFQDAGALRRGSFYVERRADTEIYEALERHLHVHFIYADIPTTEGTKKLTATHLEKVPAALLGTLREAAELLDGQRCLDVVQSIRAIDPELGERVRMMLDGLQYKELLVALDSVLARSNP